MLAGVWGYRRPVGSSGGTRSKGVTALSRRQEVKVARDDDSALARKKCGVVNVQKNLRAHQPSNHVSKAMIVQVPMDSLVISVKNSCDDCST